MKMKTMMIVLALLALIYTFEHVRNLNNNISENTQRIDRLERRINALNKGQEMYRSPTQERDFNHNQAAQDLSTLLARILGTQGLDAKVGLVYLPQGALLLLHISSGLERTLVQHWVEEGTLPATPDGFTIPNWQRDKAYLLIARSVDGRATAAWKKDSVNWEGELSSLEKRMIIEFRTTFRYGKEINGGSLTQGRRHEYSFDWYTDSTEFQGELDELTIYPKSELHSSLTSLLTGRLQPTFTEPPPPY